MGDTAVTGAVQDCPGHAASRNRPARTPTREGPAPKGRRTKRTREVGRWLSRQYPPPPMRLQSSREVWNGTPVTIASSVLKCQGVVRKLGQRKHTIFLDSSHPERCSGPAKRRCKTALSLAAEAAAIKSTAVIARAPAPADADITRIPVAGIVAIRRISVNRIGPWIHVARTVRSLL